MKKYLFGVLGILVVGSMLFAACAPKITTPVATKAATEVVQIEATTATHESVTLKFLKITDELEAKALPEIVAEFQKSEGGKYSYVSVEIEGKPWSELFTAIEKAVATGSDIDLIQADGPDVKHFAYNGVLKDVTSYFTPAEMAQWTPQSVIEGTLNGKFYGPPEEESCQLMWFNKDMLDAAGISYTDTAGWTYGANGTGLANWQKLTVDANGDGTPEVFGISTIGFYDYLARNMSRSNGTVGSPTYQGIADDGITFTGYFDTPEAVQGYQFAQDMVYEYKIMSNEEITLQLLSGLSATQASNDSIIGSMKDQYPDFNLGGIDPPYFVTPICQNGSWHYGITATTQHFDEALAFVKFMSSDAGAAIMWKWKNQMPANINLYNSIPEFTDPSNLRSLEAKFLTEHGVPRITSPAYTEYNALFTEFYTSLMAGEEDVQGLATEYAGLMDEAAAKYSDWKTK